jgi:hypothetical protein
MGIAQVVLLLLNQEHKPQVFMAQVEQDLLLPHLVLKQLAFTQQTLNLA